MNALSQAIYMPDAGLWRADDWQMESSAGLPRAAVVSRVQDTGEAR